jgi:hypothetical protein
MLRIKNTKKYYNQLYKEINKKVKIPRYNGWLGNNYYFSLLPLSPIELILGDHNLEYIKECIDNISFCLLNIHNDDWTIKTIAQWILQYYHGKLNVKNNCSSL